MPSTPTVSRCPHRSSVRPPPLPRARTSTLGRPGVFSSSSASSPPSRAQRTTKPAISSSPAPPGTSDGFTESIATRAEVSSATSACKRLDPRDLVAQVDDLGVEGGDGLVQRLDVAAQQADLGLQLVDAAREVVLDLGQLVHGHQQVVDVALALGEPAQAVGQRVQVVE